MNNFVTLKGNKIEVAGKFPNIGDSAQKFNLVKHDLSEVSLEDYKNKIKILNIFPSIDTQVCATSVRKFNKEATDLLNTQVLNISHDLPFAFSRFCAAEGIKNSDTLSTFRSSFQLDYGVNLHNGPLAGLCARAVIILNENNKVIYTELVPEITQEPDYEKALAALRKK